MLRIVAVLLVSAGAALAQNAAPRPHVIPLDSGGAANFVILHPPDSVGM